MLTNIAAEKHSVLLQPAKAMTMQACPLSRTPFQAHGRPQLRRTARSAAVRADASDRASTSGDEPRRRAGAVWAAAAAAAAILVCPMDAQAISGGKGGLGNDLDFKDMSNTVNKNGQFFKVMMRGTNWEGADLSGPSLFGSFAKGANFRGTNLTGADLESVDFDGADLTGAQLAGAQTAGAQFRNLKSIEDTDWTEVDLRRDQRAELCKIAKGVNPVTGVDTRESLVCP